MKTPSILSLPLALVLTGLLTVPSLAQTEPRVPGTTDVKQPVTQQPALQRPAPGADKQSHTSDAGGAQSRANGSDSDTRSPLKEAPGRGEARSVPVQEVFGRIDTDRDGRVSAKEYAASEYAALDMVAAGKLSGSESPRGGFDLANNENRPDRSTFFRRLDTDKDGYLSRAELENGWRSGETAGNEARSDK